MRKFYLFAFFCLLAACHKNTGNNDPGKDEPDLMSLTTRRFTVQRNPRILRYLDSLYRAQKIKTPYIKAGRYMALANNRLDNFRPDKAIIYVDSAIAIIVKQDLGSFAWK